MGMELRLPRHGLTDGTVRVRHLALRDAEAFARGTGDPSVRRFAHLPEPAYTPELVREQIDGVIEDGLRSGSLAVLTIASAGSDDFLGVITLFDIDIDIDIDICTAIDADTGAGSATAETGFWVAPWGRGGGVATRAVDLLADWCRRVLGLVALRAHTDMANEVSGRVLERAGFTEVDGPTRRRAPSGAMITARSYRRALAEHAADDQIAR